MPNSIPRQLTFYHMPLSFIILLLVGVLAPAGAYAVERVSPDLPPVYSDLIKNQAIRGYDPVAYFTESKAVPGKEEFSHEWKGATWLFSSAENRDKFIAEPEKYAPKYGGWCAYAMSQGVALSIDPESWTIYEGHLYLNARTAYTRFLGNIPGYIKDADEHWKIVEPE